MKSLMEWLDKQIAQCNKLILDSKAEIEVREYAVERVYAFEKVKAFVGKGEPQKSEPIEFEWEIVKFNVWRARVYGGWIVQHNYEDKAILVHVPDPKHEWVAK